MMLKNTVYDDIVLHNGSYSYQAPRGKVVEVPDRIGAKLLQRFPELEQVEGPATASCYHVPRAKAPAPSLDDDESDTGEGPTFEDEKESVELMPGVKVPKRRAGKPRKEA